MSKPHIQNSFSQVLLKATHMVRLGRLLGAARLIQRALLGPEATTSPSRATSPQTRRQASPPAISDPMPLPTEKRPSEPAIKAARDAAAPRQDPAPALPRTPTFTEDVFMFDAEQYPYRLYIPASPASAAASGPAGMPLIVLLHGCTQDAQDFARGTAMNALAEKHGCMVLYPEQIAKSNSARCWNWFEPGHQQLDQGEPGMIAALTQHILASHVGADGADPERVYIAGLSAGGAMAAVVAGLYPDIFAALGVHSGLAAGAAQDMLSAFGAMRRGAKGNPTTPALPTIIFHGNADKTVHPDNGEYISDAALAALTASGLELKKSQSTVTAAPEQTTERTVYSAANGPSYVEHWLVDAGPHAWSGGDAAGSYTDPDGPSASAAMLAFFLQHRKQSAA